MTARPLLHAALTLAKRREWLGQQTIRCPACAESEQIQLVWWFGIPARWKCRMCKHRWEEEPPH